MTRLVAFLTLLCCTAAQAAPPQPLVRGDWSGLLASHRGRPTIVHFWGLTCGPCLTELPEWAKFAALRKDVDLVLVDADPTTVAPEDLAAFLDKAGLAKIESWRFADSFTEKLEYEIDPQWQGELPYTLLVKGDGSVEPILGAADFAALRQWAKP